MSSHIKLINYCEYTVVRNKGSFRANVYKDRKFLSRKRKLQKWPTNSSVNFFFVKGRRNTQEYTSQSGQSPVKMDKPAVENLKWHKVNRMWAAMRSILDVKTCTFSRHDHYFIAHAKVGGHKFDSHSSVL